MNQKWRCRFALGMTAVFLCACAAENVVDAPKQYSASFLDLFDTVSTVVGIGEDEADFRMKAQKVHDDLRKYHRLFDVYHEYEGMNNLKTINDNAGIAPVEVDAAIICLLEDCKRIYEWSDGKVNVAMGGVLNLWHEAREDGRDFPEKARLPETEKLEEAAEHMNLKDVILDPEKGTVFISDPALRLDVGAIAKGWAVERAARNAPEGMLISVGGNVRATGGKNAGSDLWRIGIQDPDGTGYLHTVCIAKESVVTSGDYQRYYDVDGKRYHHIIDPDTLFPAQRWRSVTVICADSGLADALSTALFLLPLEEGRELLARAGAEGMWLDGNGECFYSSGFQQWIET